MKFGLVEVFVLSAMKPEMGDAVRIWWWIGAKVDDLQWDCAMVLV